MSNGLLLIRGCPSCGNPTLESFTGQEDFMRGLTICHGSSEEPCRPVHHIDLRRIEPQPVTLEPADFDYLLVVLGIHVIETGDTCSEQTRNLLAKLKPLLRHRVTLTAESGEEVQL